jgi:hypothetical protein
MKPLHALLTLTACACVCAAQGSPARQDAPHGLAVLRLKWERRLDVSHDGSRPARGARPVASDPDVLSDPGGLQATASRSPFPPYVYEYSVEVRNDGAKKIRWLSWAYVLSEPGGRRELGRHEFVSREKIDPGRTKTLHGRTRSTPSRVVSVERLAKGKGAAHEERVEFRCVAYDDGTWWHRPSVSESYCAEAEKRRKSR